jgi:2-polyprenyl-3-methyl-5-hydroxy-6-metoxy-1,4-benzoquinol methylase
VSSSPAYLDPVILPLIRGETVLDVGCGYGRWGHLVQSNFWEAGLSKPPVVDGFDAFQANVDYCSKQNSYRRVWQQSLPSQLTDRWDTVLACEVIEHIEQKNVEQVLSVLENAAKRRIIFSTPNWPAFRPGAETIVGYNEHEAHLSYLSRSFFRNRGYTLLGAGFGNPHNLPSRIIRKCFLGWAPMLDSLSRVVPIFANSLVAYKDVN